MTNIDEIAEKAARDERSRKAIRIIAVKYDEATKIHLEKVYTDPELHSIYNALRSSAKVDDKLIKGEDRKLCIKFPDGIVKHFLNDIFSHKYGDDWLHDKAKLSKICRNEDLIKPWLLRAI